MASFNIRWSPFANGGTWRIDLDDRELEELREMSDEEIKDYIQDQMDQSPPDECFATPDNIGDFIAFVRDQTGG